MGMGLPQSGNEYEMYTRETNITTEKTAAVDAVELNPTVAGTIAKKLKDANTYSTDEKVIGTWIDGKPLYGKVVVFNNTTGTGSSGVAVPHGIANFKLGYVRNYVFNQTGDPDWYSHYDTHEFTTAIKINSTNIVSFIKQRAGTIYFFLEYTKTTD